MHTIEVDFDVLKTLMVMRETEAVSFNDVMRRVLELPTATVGSHAPSGGAASDAWVAKGVVFPPSTEFRARYKGTTYTGRVEAGALNVGGKRFDSPSAAAVAITGSAVNGWRFWEYRRPGDTGWSLMAAERAAT